MRRIKYSGFAGIALTLLALWGCAQDVQILDGPYVMPKSPTEATVTWETALPGDSWVDYGLTDSYGTRRGAEEAEKSHRVTLTDLQPGRDYYYRISSAGSRREGRFTAGVTFAKGPYWQNVTPASITLMWETHPPAAAQVVYGPAETWTDTLRAEAAALHEVVLSGLASGTAYRCRVLAGGMSSPEASFRTPAPGDATFTCIVYGDSRHFPEPHGNLVLQMLKHDADFAINSGDLVDDGQEEGLWEPQFFDPIRPLGRRMPFYTTLGNHDRDAPAYYRYFSLPDNGSQARPEAWYAFRYENAHVIVLDTDIRRFRSGDEQVRWLERELKTSDATWKVVVTHYPLYSSGRHGSSVEVREILMPVFERYGVDLVMAGHDHGYERTWPLRDGKRQDGGVVHVVSAGGGAELYPFGHNWWTAMSVSCYNFCVLRISGKRLDMDVFDIQGEAFDAFTILKDRTAVDALIAGAKGSDAPRRLEAVEHLGRIGLLEAAPAVAALVGAESVGLRRAVARALARIGSPEQAAAMVSLSGDDDTPVRQWVVRGLADLGGDRAARVCLERLTDADPLVRRTAAVGLARNPLRQAVAALAGAAQDADADVRLEAVKALAVAPGGAADKAVISALRDASPAVREAAFEGVTARSLQRRAVAVLVDVLPQESPEMRRQMVYALGEAGNPVALPALIERLQDGEAGVRQAAAIALGKLKAKTAVEALVRAVDDPDRRVSTYAMRALTVITGEVLGLKPDAWKQWWERRQR